MMSDFYGIIGIGVVILFILAYLYIKDLENAKKLKSYEKSIEELNKQIHSLRKIAKEYEENKHNTEIDSSNNKRHIDSKLNEVRAELQNDVKQALNSLSPLISVLEEIQKSFQIHKNKIDRRMGEIEDRVKAVISIPTISNSLDESKIVAMFKNGRTMEEIAKDLRVTKGEVELILKIANFDINKKNEKTDKFNKK